MAYIGLRPVSNFLTTASETFSGDGNTKQFIMLRSVSKAEDLEVFVGSTQILPNSGFSATGKTLDFVNAPAFGTNNITVIFRAGALQSLDVTRTGNPAGTAAAPALYFTGATNTGIYWPATTRVAIATSGTDRVIFDDSSASSSTTTGALQVKGGIGATGNLYLGGIVRQSDTTQSSSPSTGAFTTAGGAGVAKDLNVGGSINVTGDFTVAGTFTTTTSASLAIDDPFVYLAGTNSGDSLDQGLIGKYVDGSAVTRYTGLFRDVTDGKYKIFANLTARPVTTVDTANVSYQLSDMELRSLNVKGTMFAEGGGAASSTTTGALQVTGGLGVTGDVYAASFNTTGAITATGSIGNLASVTASGTIQTTGRIYANAGIQATATSVGAIVIPNNGGIAVSGNAYVGGNVVVTGNIFPAANAATNIGSTSLYWNNIFAKAVNADTFSGISNQAKYADLAENYLADAVYTPGTVLHFGGAFEVSQCNVDMCTRVAGVVSSHPAYLMNKDLEGEHVTSLALTGRVPCKVTGAIAKGDMLVSAGNGRARAESNPRVGTVIGKSLEDFAGGEGMIEIVVGRH